MTDPTSEASSGSITVAFRLDPFTHHALEQRARQLDKTPGVLAREIIKKALDADESDHLSSGLEQIGVAVGNLQRRVEQTSEKQDRLLKTAVAGLLVELGNLSTDQANEWIAYYLADSD